MYDDVSTPLLKMACIHAGNSTRHSTSHPFVQICSESVEYGPVWFDFRKPNLPPGPRSSLTTTARGSSRRISPERSEIDHEHPQIIRYHQHPSVHSLMRILQDDQDVQVYQVLFLDGIPILPHPSSTLLLY